MPEDLLDVHSTFDDILAAKHLYYLKVTEKLCNRAIFF